MIKYNLNNINDWDYGDDTIKKVYHHNSVCYQKISKGDTYNLFGKTKSSSPFTIRLNNVNETVTIVKDNGDGTYDWGLKYTNPIIDTTSMCIGNTNLLSFDWDDVVLLNRRINSGAFSGCTSLSSVTIPDSVTNIENTAFRFCRSLTSITIPNSVTSIGGMAFESCTSLTSVTIPDSVTSIGGRVFNDCGIVSMTVDNDNVVYDSRNNCNAIINTATNTLIYGCKNTVIPNSVTSIGDNSFFACGGLTSITIPNSVTSIGEAAFYVCRNLTSVTIGNSVTSIGSNALRDCAITSVTIPDSVTSIGETAFFGNNSLTSVTIGNGVTSIGKQAFYNCRNLSSLTIEATTPPTLGANVFGVTNNCPIYVPSASVDTYKTSWSSYADRIQAIP